MRRSWFGCDDAGRKRMGRDQIPNVLDSFRNSKPFVHSIKKLRLKRVSSGGCELIPLFLVWLCLRRVMARERPQSKDSSGSVTCSRPLSKSRVTPPLTSWSGTVWRQMGRQRIGSYWVTRKCRRHERTGQALPVSLNGESQSSSMGNDMRTHGGGGNDAQAFCCGTSTVTLGLGLAPGGRAESSDCLQLLDLRF